MNAPNLKDKVEIPSVHLARFNEGVNRTKPVKDIYGWGSSTIPQVAVNDRAGQVLAAHALGLEYRLDFTARVTGVKLVKKSHYVDENEWTIFENTHDAIIDQETFDNVQRIRGNSRRYPAVSVPPTASAFSF